MLKSRQGSLSARVAFVLRLRPVALAPLLAVAVVLSGCFFPPIAPAGDVEPQDEVVVSHPQVPLFEQQTYQRSETGAVSAGAYVPLGVAHGGMPHIFDLPQRVILIHIELDWNHTVADLDLSAELRLPTANGTEVTWSEENREGDTGAPDNPVEIFVTDRALITFGDMTRLRITVSAKAGVDVPYTLSVRAIHLVPA
jgi:hypothetical protein